MFYEDSLTRIIPLERYWWSNWRDEVMQTSLGLRDYLLQWMKSTFHKPLTWRLEETISVLLLGFHNEYGQEIVINA